MRSSASKRMSSQRPPVDSVRIREFLEALSGRFRGNARIFLVGGTTLVLEGYRALTVDVDLTFDVDPALHGEFVRAIRDLANTLAINIEQVSPEDFIPKLPGAADRARFIDTFGGLTVYHFDPYSTALSKIARGRHEDFLDVERLIAEGWLDWTELERLFADVLPRMATESLKGDPDDFQRKFDVLRVRTGHAA